MFNLPAWLINKCHRRCQNRSLGIPFQYKFKAVKETAGPDGKLERREVEETATGNAYFLPQSLKIDGDVQTQTLHRGIYDAAVFRAQVTLSGKF
jgi:inner membrane protein